MGEWSVTSKTRGTIKDPKTLCTAECDVTLY